MNRPSAEKAASLIVKHKVNSFFMSPSLFIGLVDYCKRKGIKPLLDKIVIGTEAMPGVKSKEAIEFFGPVIQEGYGMVEVLPPLSGVDSRDYMKRGTLDEAVLLSAGRAFKGVKIKVVNRKKMSLPPKRIGRIAVKSGTISKGYWKMPELTRRHYKKGWFYTDDYGYLDKKGYLYILGRKRDIIRENKGNPFFTRQVEEVLHGHPRVLGACVFVSARKRLIACVSERKSSKSALKPEELLKFCGHNLEEYGIPDAIKIVSELPINASGKTDRKKIKSKFSKGILA
jgi:fatty-acyl-CoA synthase